MNPFSQCVQVRRHPKERLKLGEIRKSDSPWANAIVLVKRNMHTFGYA